MKFKQPRIFYFLAGILFLLNLVQAYFTELIYDEAYYWYYARDLAWGYFDHPPLVALLISLSEFFFNGEMGVRFISCILSVGTLFLIWDCIDGNKKNDYIPHYFLLYFSITLLNAYGFFTLPDTPLLFFLAFFLWTYKKFLDKPGMLYGVVLGITMACLMYSKYHAALIIIFVLLSNIKLLSNKYAWLALITSLIFYLPHLIWLYENEFVSIVYHIFERPNRAYEFGDFTLGFFVNLLVLFGLTFPWIYRSLIKAPSKDLFDRSLKFIVYGFIIFFFISSFSRRIQTQWLIAICIPLLIITFKYLLEDHVTRKWIFRMAVINGILLLYLRIGLAYAPLFPVHYESHGNKAWVQDLVDQIGDTPVVFENSYRRASMFQFYSGSDAYSLNNIWYRQNQYAIDNSEERVQNRDVVYISKFLKKGDLYYTDSNGRKLYGNFIRDFKSYRKLECIMDPIEGDENPKEWSFTMSNPYNIGVPINKLKFGMGYLNKYKQLMEKSPLEVRQEEIRVDTLLAGESMKFTFDLELPQDIEPSYIKISISEHGLPFGLNGNNVKLAE